LQSLDKCKDTVLNLLVQIYFEINASIVEQEYPFQMKKKQ